MTSACFSSSTADVHRSGPAGPKLRRDRRRQWRGRRSGVLAGRGDDQRWKQPERGRLPVRRGQSHRQRSPPVTGERERGEDDSIRKEEAKRSVSSPSNAEFTGCLLAQNISTLETLICQNT